MIARGQTRRFFAGYAAFVALGTLLVAGPVRGAIREGRGDFQSNGKKISVEVFEPTGAGKHPAIILLHGSAGVLFPGLDLRKRARQLADEGYATFLVHYFNRTGHLMVSHAQVHENLATWTHTVRESITSISSRPGVDPQRIGVMGHSLGAYLSLKAAAEDSRIKVVIAASGALDATDEVMRMPPTFVLHGARDKTVPVAKAYRLDALLKRTRTPHQMHIYPEEAHIYSRAAMVDASQRIEAFLAKYFPAKSSSSER